MIRWFRIFTWGGVMSFRALFPWLTPWVYVAMLVIAPFFEMLFFAYLGRASGTESDSYFVVGNALIACAIAGLWGMSHSVNGERRSQTLPSLLGSPAPRTALFLGRAVPALVNGLVIAAFCLLMGVVFLDFTIARQNIPALVLAVAITSTGAAALGMCVGAIGLRGRNVTAIDNIVLAVLMLVSGAFVPVERLPRWLDTAGSALPLRHGVEAARELAAGAAFGDVGGLLVRELLVACVFAAAGFALLRVFEWQGRRTASLDVF